MIWNKVFSLNRKIFQGILHSHVRKITVSKILRADFYETLGVKRDATQAEIKNAYFELTKMYHPDRIAATDENLAKFRAISAAYEVLGNEQSRKLYDRGLVEDPKDLAAEDDPIIRFYKHRQQRSQVPTTGLSKEELDQWTSQIYKSARESKREQIDLFKASKDIADDDAAQKRQFIFTNSVFLVLGILFLSCLEDHSVRKYFLDLFGEDGP